MLFFSVDPTGGDASGVKLVSAWGRLVALREELSLVRPSREWVAAGVRGGDCTAEVGGDGRGEAKAPVPCPLRSLDSRDATYEDPRLV